MVIFQFLFFYFLLYSFGRAVFQLLNLYLNNKGKSVAEKIFGFNIEFFFPVLGLFVLGNIVVIFNFFSGINNIIFWIILILIFAFNFLKAPKIKVNPFNILNYILIPTILSISTKDLGLHPDTGLYHLNYQNWIRNEKIAAGLTNMNERFGYSSIYDFISAPLWFGDNFILLQFVNLSFIVLFFHFLSYNLLNKNNKDLFMASYFIILFGLLDNFGFGGGRNGFLYIEGIGKPDVAFAVIFFITNILLISSIRSKQYNNQDFLVASLLVLFSIQLRVFGILSLFLLGYYFLELSKYKISIIKNKIMLLIPSILLGSLWMLKNTIISSCLFFPVEFTCIHSLSWNKFEHAENAAYIVQDFYYGLPTEDGFVGWYNHWMSSPHNSALAKNFLLSLLIITIFRLLFFKGKLKTSLPIKIITFVFLFLNLYLWLYNAPAIRLAMGTILLCVGVLGFGNLDLRFKNRLFNLYENKILITLIIIFCTLLTPRIYKYSDFLKNPFESYFAGVEITETVDNPRGWGVTPKEGHECEVNINCVPYAIEVTQITSDFLNYKIFIPPEEWNKYGG
tara:strand:+ start:1086 stop:2777 length:1692 start_codon:yes stop_codon:yes gene_type:complete